ncbi:hypothetical protein J4423_05055 [Candidatus Pacearchaeota archaeon]|nr:hypothetical protein [Candidatus Pacearchaeota archaeon]
MQLSKKENNVYEELKKLNLEVFTIKDLKLIFKLDSIKAYNIIKALKRKGAIKKEKSIFTLKGTDQFTVGTSAHYPSYISLWSALNYYGWSDQTPKKILIISTKYAKETRQFKYITLKNKRFFGYNKIGNIIIAEKEKAIIDSILFPKYAGGIKEICSCLKEAFNELNKEKLIDYALKIDSKAVIRRLGFLLETNNYKKTAELKKNLGKGYEKLDPSLKKKNKLNKDWLLDINTS